MAAPPLMNDADATALAIATLPAAAMGMTCIAGANSIGIAMANGVAAQQRGQLIAQAATNQVVAQIIVKGGAG